MARTIAEALAPYQVTTKVGDWPCKDGLSFDDCRKQHTRQTCEGRKFSYRTWLRFGDAFWNAQRSEG